MFKKTQIISSDEEIEKEKEKKPGYTVIKNTTDLQRVKLEKLMKNPDKPVIIPERPKPRDVPIVPDFVRNVMGSSAGAGSGEFHVYRHLRRKEYARQRYMKEKAERERLDEEFEKKIEANKLAADAKTAKKRAKRLKMKAKLKQKGKKPKLESSQSEKSKSESEDSTDSETQKEESEKDKECVETQKKSEKVSESNQNVTEDKIDEKCQKLVNAT